MKLGYLALLAIGFGVPAMADPLTAFDVAEDLTRFVHAPGPLHDDGLPAYGVPFVTQGYIYPAGTLDGGVEGTNEDGTPVWPDKLIGVWTCSGYTVGDGFHTTTGDVVITRQVYQFDTGDILVSQGSEVIDEGVSIVRAITGGTGDYADIGPAITQVMLGMSEGFGVRLQYEITPRGAEAPS
jgi:hypothetical protein